MKRYSMVTVALLFSILSANMLFADTIPDIFTFTDRTDVALNTEFKSNAITVSGIDAAAPISITGGTYSINGGTYTSASGSVSVGNTVKVRKVSAGTYSTTKSAILTIGGVSDTFSVTTMIDPVDTTPDSFTFTDRTNVALNTELKSNAITVSGINAASPISITGGTYSINGGAYTGTSSTVNLGNTVKVRKMSASTYTTTKSATLTIGGVSDTFSVTTLAATTFTTADLVGTWNMYSVTSGITSGDRTDWLGWIHGVTSINSSGVMTWSSITRSDDNSTLPGSATLSISSSGIVTMAGAASFHGVMSQDKSTFVATMDDGGGGYNLMIWQKSAGSFTTADLVGTWNMHSVTSGVTSGDRTDWLGWIHGVTSINSSGVMTWSSITRSDDNSTLPGSATLSISSSGIVTMAGAASFHGVMSQDKSTFVATMDDGGGGYNLMIWQK